MPNYIKNVWKISKLKENSDYILNKLTRYSPEDNTYKMDFDLIIPEPRFKQDCPKDCIRTSCSYIQEDETRPWFDWYAWHNSYWGVKWNACDAYCEQSSTWIKIIFSTPWSFPTPIAEKVIELAKAEGLDLDLRYADEDLGSNCGRITYCSHTDEINKYYNTDLSSDTVKWAERLWENY